MISNPILLSSLTFKDLVCHSVFKNEDRQQKSLCSNSLNWFSCWGNNDGENALLYLLLSNWWMLSWRTNADLYVRSSSAWKKRVVGGTTHEFVLKWMGLKSLSIWIADCHLWFFFFLKAVYVVIWCLQLFSVDIFLLETDFVVAAYWKENFIVCE